MKRYIRIVLVVLIFFIILDIIVSFFSTGKIVNYNVSDGIENYEVLENYQKNEGYYFEIKFDDNVFNFILNDVFNNDSYVVDKIYSFKNKTYACILPIFNDENIYTDILCLKKNTIYPYRSIKNESLVVDKFAASMKDYGYQVSKNNDTNISLNGIKLFNENLIASHIITIPSYRGVYIIDSSSKDIISSIELFDKDIYSQKIQCVVSNYYVIADYNEKYSFNVFYILNLKNNKVFKITSDNTISMDSYVQGVVDDTMYIMDRSNKRQYKIDISNKSITMVGNTEKGVIYYSGSDYEYKSVYDAINDDLLFKESSIQSNKSDIVYLKDHIYYSYLKVDDGYDIYISYENNPSIYTFGFHVNDINRINYTDDYIYYIDGDGLFYYNPSIGSLRVLSYSELQYNKNLNIGIYKK